MLAGVEPALMYAPELITVPSHAEFVMGTGSATGLYNETCQKLSKQLTEYKVRCEENTGSIDNLEGLISGGGTC